ncbi:MAG: hypothetical protein JSW70_06390 [Syntrophobacterales bacterium]|nr:MAG: hypothetical protein JSW70_06390 [Syntrophobacterales bacterium]
MAEMEEIRKVKDKHGAKIMAKKNVVGMGIGYKETKGAKTDHMALVVMVRRKVSVEQLRERDVIPAEIEGVITDVIEVGEIVALQERTDRWRPAPGGVSIGHYKITAGTLGVLVRDVETDEILILSNNHVMANSNDATLGDSILQPGPYDGGTEVEDTIANLVRFVPIQFESEPPPSPCSVSKAAAGITNFFARLVGSKHRLLPVVIQQANQVDGALAKPTSPDVVSNEILEIGSVMEDTEAELGMEVKKSGRTTGLTTGTVELLDASVQVEYGAGKTALFTNQILTTNMSKGGDSGSLLVAEERNKAVGLLFAGSDQVTIHNPIGFVKDALKIHFS